MRLKQTLGSPSFINPPKMQRLPYIVTVEKAPTNQPTQSDRQSDRTNSDQDRAGTCVKCAWRFSRNALKPSCASGVTVASAMTPAANS